MYLDLKKSVSISVKRDVNLTGARLQFMFILILTTFGNVFMCAFMFMNTNAMQKIQMMYL